MNLKQGILVITINEYHHHFLYGNKIIKNKSFGIVLKEVDSLSLHNLYKIFTNNVSFDLIKEKEFKIIK